MLSEIAHIADVHVAPSSHVVITEVEKKETEFHY